MWITSRYERIGLGDKRVRQIGQYTSARKDKQKIGTTPLPSGKCSERREVVTKGKGRKKWNLLGTCNGTNHRNIVPTEDESCVKRRKDRCVDVKDGS
jgi:hypothetical protein